MWINFGRRIQTKNAYINFFYLKNLKIPYSDFNKNFLKYFISLHMTVFSASHFTVLPVIFFRNNIFFKNFKTRGGESTWLTWGLAKNPR